MAKMYVHNIIVNSKMFPFPMDMLRYDGLWPSETEDAVNISSSIMRDLEPFTNITLTCVAEKGWVPTTPRWKSFGWNVVEHQIRG